MQRRRSAGALVGAGLALLTGVHAADAATPHPVAVTVHADDGGGRIAAPGLPCAEGGQGSSWHHEWTAPLGVAVAGAPSGELLVHLDLHSDVPDRAFLLGDESTATIANERGTIQLTLRSGSCPAPTLLFDGGRFDGGGTWVVDHGTGAYGTATGAGTFTVTGAVGPGADNPLDLALTGTIDAAAPALRVEVVSTYWGSLGTDYLTRRPTVLLRITNVGTADAYGARLTGVTSSTAGATVLGPTQVASGDLRVGASVTAAVRFELGLLTGPCKLVLLGCRFAVTAAVDLPDAFGTSHPATATVTAQAPLLPPPL